MDLNYWLKSLDNTSSELTNQHFDNKTGINFMIFIVGLTMLYIIFQFGWEAGLIQQILTGFEAILKKILDYLYPPPCLFLSCKFLACCALIDVSFLSCVEIVRERENNVFNGIGYIITWILHQIFMFSNKVKLAAG